MQIFKKMLLCLSLLVAEINKSSFAPGTKLSKLTCFLYSLLSLNESLNISTFRNLKVPQNHACSNYSKFTNIITDLKYSCFVLFLIFSSWSSSSLHKTLKQFRCINSIFIKFSLISYTFSLLIVLFFVLSLFRITL